MNIPLDEYKVLQSGDLDEVREHLTSFYGPHSLNFKSSRRHLNTHHHRVSFGDISFNYLSYGAHVKIIPGELESFYLLEIPLSGSSVVSYGKHTVMSEATTGIIVSSTQPVSCEWSGDAKRLMVQIDRDVMERYASSLLGHALNKPLEFELELDLSSGIGAGLRSYVEYITQQVNTDNYFDKYLLVRGQVMRTILTMLFNGQPSNYSEEVKAIEAPGAPKHIQKAYDYIMENYDEDIRIDDVVRESGVPARSLFAGFKRYKGVSPMMALKSRRLQAAHDELKQASGRDTIKGIARRWGFSHRGNFAKDYQKLFGQQPSDTIRKYK